MRNPEQHVTVLLKQLYKCIMYGQSHIQYTYMINQEYVMLSNHVNISHQLLGPLCPFEFQSGVVMSLDYSLFKS